MSETTKIPEEIDIADADEKQAAGCVNSGETKGDTSSAKAPLKNEDSGFVDAKDPTRYGDWEIAGRCIDF